MKKIIALVLSLCMLATMFVLPAMADTTYTGVGAGKNGEGSIEVSVTLDDNLFIVDVTVTHNGDDANISDPAVEQMPARIVEGQTIAADAVTGATLTSNGILDAVKNALQNGGVDLASYTPAVEEEEIMDKSIVEETVEVLVIGAGIAGLTAAMSAKENGAEVVIIDKMSIPGGTTNVAGGILVCVDSELFANNRLDTDNMESIVAYWEKRMAQSGAESGYPDWDRLTGVLADTGDTVDWLVANDVGFAETPFPLSAQYPMALANGGGAGLINMLVASCEARGIELRLNTCGVSLLNDENGAVVGAVAETEDNVIIFHTKSVVLATGGISQNQELVEKYSPKLSRVGLIPTSAVSHTGDGFLMALEVGAGTFDTFATPLYTTTVDPELAALTDVSMLTMPATLGVNADGDRYANEAAGAGWDSMDADPSNMIQNAKGPFWFVYDSSNADVVAALETGVEVGVVAKGETVEELALNMHVYTANFVKAYNDYAAAVEAGVDEQFGKDAAFLQPIAQAPFYAVKRYPTTFGSAGGVTTTDQGRVTRQDGTVIPGLYAAGEMSNRYFYNENYILAASLGLYSTMGRRAGAAAAADALAK